MGVLNITGPDSVKVWTFTSPNDDIADKKLVLLQHPGDAVYVSSPSVHHSVGAGTGSVHPSVRACVRPCVHATVCASVRACVRACARACVRPPVRDVHTCLRLHTVCLTRPLLAQFPPGWYHEVLSIAGKLYEIQSKRHNDRTKFHTNGACVHLVGWCTPHDLIYSALANFARTCGLQTLHKNTVLLFDNLYSNHVQKIHDLPSR